MTTILKEDSPGKGLAAQCNQLKLGKKEDSFLQK